MKNKIIATLILTIIITTILPIITVFADNKSTEEKYTLKIYSEAALLVDSKT